MVTKIRKTLVKGKRVAVKLTFRKGLLDKAVNPKGKGNVAIVQRKDFTGFTALSGGIRGRRIDRARNAEDLVKRLIKKGKKKVEIFD